MYWVISFDDTSSVAIFLLSMYRPQSMLVMEDIHLFCYSILLWTIIGHTNGHQDGASVTSCYNHIISHSTFGIPFPVLPCNQSLRCSPLTLTVFCPEQQDMYCCRDLDSNIMYTHCNYTCEFRIQLACFTLLFLTQLTI